MYFGRKRSAVGHAYRAVFVYIVFIRQQNVCFEYFRRNPGIEQRLYRAVNRLHIQARERVVIFVRERACIVKYSYLRNNPRVMAKIFTRAAELCDLSVYGIRIPLFRRIRSARTSESAAESYNLNKILTELGSAFVIEATLVHESSTPSDPTAALSAKISSLDARGIEAVVRRIIA